MKRVEMSSPVASGVAMVPEARVDAMKARGWKVTEKPAAKKSPAKSEASSKSAPAKKSE